MVGLAVELGKPPAPILAALRDDLAQPLEHRFGDALASVLGN
jgi:hypothetical protein